MRNCEERVKKLKFHKKTLAHTNVQVAQKYLKGHRTRIYCGNEETIRGICVLLKGEQIDKNARIKTTRLYIDDRYSAKFKISPLSLTMAILTLKAQRNSVSPAKTEIRIG
ncbi:hypothetical protein TOT_030000566 [Theileria orientalis strain Shintoku]|uniref:Uncharacterized protein n=1 Tax=Theileria orientalis strain Shintoku TaxID=869250 RepID=J4C8S6_THEOR|nr:hypothetical protein TOT_030000566 [Theileria orientalis strain Shintoku]BAM41303.1 hypothetical protein TOT_030000566 [Theileria orientalis strain Shintoku]|eukprot:XP_009691604.1 hypothetical protein TOT_030000566 [Theileria orientalis strain Shintoku]